MTDRFSHPDLVTLAVLAGGEGRRMGRAKGEICLAGQPVLEFLLSRWNWPGPTLLVTAPGREHPTGWTRFDREVSDPVAGLGPLRGMLTAIEHCATELLLIATVDMPGVENAQLGWLVDRAAREHEASRGIFLAVRSGEATRRRRIEPFPALLRRAARDAVARQLLPSGGDASVQALARRAEFCVLDAPPEWPARTWTNLNRPEDVERFAP